jgi:phage portal protein BeeE
MKLWDRLQGRAEVERSGYPLSLDEYGSWFQYQNAQYPLYGLNTTLPRSDREEAVQQYGGLDNNGVVFACMDVRMKLFSEARFQFRQLRSGRPGDLFGSPALGILEQPWPNGTTSDLLKRAMQDVDRCGNFYVAREGNRLMRLRPDWVDIVLGSRRDPEDPAGEHDATVLGYVYWAGGKGSGKKGYGFLVEQVAHFAPIPDPLASFRGMSWLSPIVREIMGDSLMTNHKLEFFENAATPNMTVSLPESVRAEAFNRWVEQFKAGHEGRGNQYKTLFLGGGADASVVGANFEQMDFKVVQGAGETRIAAAAGVPPVLVGLSEGLAAATYSNYSTARRRFADGTMRPLWRDMAGSLSTLVNVPQGSELWYDDRDISFLQEDLKDAAEIQSTQAMTIKALTDAGFEAQSAIDAVLAGDFKRLTHTGLFSVQLQPPMPEQPQANGNGMAKQLPVPSSD